MVQSLWINIDSVREMTIGHPPQREEKDPRTLQLPQNPKLNDPKLQGVLLHFISLQLRFFNPSTSLFFTRNPKSKVETPFSVNCDSFCMKKTHP